ncbi:MAG: glycoside hydrolase family 130 protein [Mycobacteriales bacterium]
MNPGTAGHAVRDPRRLRADPRRVITRLFLPGEEVPEASSRTAAVLDRILSLPEPEVATLLADTTAGFTGRHRDLEATLLRHYQAVGHRLNRPARLSRQRQLLIGAYFTHEYAVEAAALFNPSMVAHPDQSGMPPGQVRFVMSVRGVGEGHLSSIGFRTGRVGPGTTLSVDEVGGPLVTGTRRAPVYERALFQAKLVDLGGDSETAAFVLDGLPARFDPARLAQATSVLHPQLLSHPTARQILDQIRLVAAASYDVEFPVDSTLDERVLWPTGPTEAHGMEDARFVRFVDDDQAVTYYATYTAFDGAGVAPQLLETRDFRTFHVTQLAGTAASNKGMALFPRRLDGRFLALSRGDGESIALSSSPDGRCWEPAKALWGPTYGWELIQVGNCGSPVETERGWLVLTHGVGPLRTYRIGAILLDRHDPARVIATLPEPLLAPADDEREGYVPNVVYSCGPLLHHDVLTIPYGISDSGIGFAHLHVAELLERMLPIA